MTPEEKPPLSPEEAMFQEAVSAVDAGERTRARDLLTRLIKANRDQPDYWLLMSAVVDTVKERAYCLTEVLRIDPNHALARRGLALIGQVPPDPQAPPPKPVQRRNWMKEMGMADNQDSKSLRNFWLRSGLIASGLLVLVCLVAAGIFGVSRSLSPQPTPLPLAPLGPSGPTSTYQPTASPVVRSATPTFLGPTPLWMLLPATYTPTPLYVATEHRLSEAYRLAITAHARKDWTNFNRYIQQAATAEPRAVDILYYLGESQRLLGNFSQAITHYNQAISINGAFAPPYLGRARANLERQAKTGEKFSDDPARDLETAIEKDTGFAEPYLDLAALRLARGDPTGAMNVLNTGEKAVSGSPLYYLYRAQVHLQNGNIASALEDARRANQMDSTLLPAYRIVGQCLQLSGNVKDSLAPLRTYTIFEVKDAEAFAWLAQALLANQQEAAALEAAETALRINRNLLDAILARGAVRLARKDNRGALDDFTLALKQKPDSFAANLGMGKSYLASGVIPDANYYFDRSLPLARSDSEKAEGYYWRAQGAEAAGQREIAINSWQALLALPGSSYPPEWAERARQNLQVLSATATPMPTPSPIVSPTASPTP
ncbi:MAG TPA: tetratricopeptide repeat protein [Anaerolineaceae bacterium]